MGDTNELLKFSTYEEYLDSKITQEHLYYLGSKDVARQLFELGCVGGLEISDRNKFMQAKQAQKEQQTAKHTAQVPLAHIGCDISHSPLMQHLAELEEKVRGGYATCLIFLRSINSLGQEVSAYIDYGDRLSNEDWTLYFNGKKDLKPKITDVSYFNWKTRTVHRNPSTHFELKANGDQGLLVTNKKDQKNISLDPSEPTPGDNAQRIDIQDPKYLHCVLYIHGSRRRV